MAVRSAAGDGGLRGHRLRGAAFVCGRRHVHLLRTRARGTSVVSCSVTAPPIADADGAGLDSEAAEQGAKLARRERPTAVPLRPRRSFQVSERREERLRRRLVDAVVREHGAHVGEELDAAVAGLDGVGARAREQQRCRTSPRGQEPPAWSAIASSGSQLSAARSSRSSSTFGELPADRSRELA